MQTDLQRLAALIDGWSQTDQIPDVERDLALQKLRDLYEAIRFAGPEAVQAKEVSAEACPKCRKRSFPNRLIWERFFPWTAFPIWGSPKDPSMRNPRHRSALKLGRGLPNRKRPNRGLPRL